jgi:hypothetical protein
MREVKKIPAVPVTLKGRGADMISTFGPVLYLFVLVAIIINLEHGDKDEDEPTKKDGGKKRRKKKQPSRKYKIRKPKRPEDLDIPAYQRVDRTPDHLRYEFDRKK